MRAASLLALVCALAAAPLGAGCPFAPDPAPCLADENCPDALACVAGFCARGGLGEGEGEAGEGEGEAGEGEGEGECFVVAELIVRVDDDMDILTGRDCVTVTGDLDVSNFFGGPADLELLLAVVDVGGDLLVTSNNSFGTLDGMANVAHVGGSLRIESNSVLNDVDALANTTVDGDLSIVSNAVLLQCDAEALAAAIAENGLGGTATVESNLFDSCT